MLPARAHLPVVDTALWCHRNMVAGIADSGFPLGHGHDLLPARAHLPLGDTALWRNG